MNTDLYLQTFLITVIHSALKFLLEANSNVVVQRLNIVARRLKLFCCIHIQPRYQTVRCRLSYCWMLVVLKVLFYVFSIRKDKGISALKTIFLHEVLE